MLSFARVLSSTLWAELDPNEVITVDSKLELLVDVSDKDGRGASYWQVDFSDAESLGRMVAAFATSRDTLNNLNVGVVAVEEVDLIQVGYKRSNATNTILDKEFGNSSHFDLFVDTAAKAIKMASLIKQNVIPYSAKNVRRYVKASLDRNYFKVGNFGKNLLLDLGKQNYLTFSDVANQPPGVP